MTEIKDNSGYETKGHVQKKVVLLAERSAKGQPPPPTPYPGLNEVFSQKYQFF